MKQRRGSAAEWEIAVHMAQELYPMDRKKREEYVEWTLHKDDPFYIPHTSIDENKVRNDQRVIE